MAPRCDQVRRAHWDSRWDRTGTALVLDWDLTPDGTSAVATAKDERWSNRSSGCGAGFQPN